MVANLDFAFVSELVTRLTMVFSAELQPFLIDMDMLFKQTPLDFYSLGFRWGILWKMMFDLKISS
jgi:hypothetical protein